MQFPSANTISHLPSAICHIYHIDPYRFALPFWLPSIWLSSLQAQNGPMPSLADASAAIRQRKQIPSVVSNGHAHAQAPPSAVDVFCASKRCNEGKKMLRHRKRMQIGNLKWNTSKRGRYIERKRAKRRSSVKGRAKSALNCLHCNFNVRRVVSLWAATCFHIAHTPRVAALTNHLIGFSCSLHAMQFII